MDDSIAYEARSVSGVEVRRVTKVDIRAPEKYGISAPVNPSSPTFYMPGLRTFVDIRCLGIVVTSCRSSVGP